MLKKIRSAVSRLVSKQTTFETHFNVPIKFKHSADMVINERIVEMPFVFSSIPLGNEPQKILDFGCSRSWLSLSLASMGHAVHGIDLRDHPFGHPNFEFQKMNILDYQEQDFDYVISLSTMEHVGLGAYGEPYSQQALVEVVKKVHFVLKRDGTLLLTLPVGISSVDNFEKSFAPAEIIDLVTDHHFHLKESRYYKRGLGIHWQPCTQEDISVISNDFKARKKFGSGVNGVGCFNFVKN